MGCQLPADCLNEIFEYLEKDKPALYSCLLVNRLWCEVSVEILWKNIWNFKSYRQKYSQKVASSLLSTFITCLPNDSKEVLYKNEIFISTPTPKQSLFNYVAFCKVLSIIDINEIVYNALKDIPCINLLSVDDRNRLVTNEVTKMFTNQISSLKKLIYYYNYSHKVFSSAYFPGMKELSELCCSSNLPSDFYYQMSQICHNLKSITIEFGYDDHISNELKELISLQNNLKILTLSIYMESWTNIIPSLTKHSNTLTKLRIYYEDDHINYYFLPLSFISLFSNLQEIIFSFTCLTVPDLKDFKNLQHVKFPKLQILKFLYQNPKPKYLMKFIENNGKNLRELYICENNNILNSSIANFCPNLKSLFIIFNDDEIDILKNILISCRYLVSIKIQCGDGYLTEKEVLETIANYSSSNFCELKIYNESCTNHVSSEDLESFLIIWKNRNQKNILRFIIIENDNKYKCLSGNEENKKIIEKYVNLGIIKFEIKLYGEEEEEEENLYFYA
ncbi:hypothetical protein RclHR1_11510003 [Rhizophagus clarus]|uniref:F-box domain-containing protein n=1 Tax=Rhizophagus clarus TaxID=94130 RepID=A0A2Z6QGP7_9GLOM|nr:hypothetical protein RclHR1_11510003 [Rhizophagus clarus]GES83996.1 hypothetical protein GLOIN_2v1876445 [Rhizophagus clarus]